jgi:5-methylcytosine-specific restriction protein A
MPTVPTNPKCSVLGCKHPRSKFNSFCIEHGGRDKFDYKRYNKSDKYKQGQDKYQSSQWRTLRQVQLSLEPLCASCLTRGIVTQAEHIDHVFPWQQIGEQAFYHNLFQSLCASCHSSKTSLEAKGIFKHYKANKDYTIIDYNRVVKANGK